MMGPVLSDVAEQILEVRRRRKYRGVVLALPALWGAADLKAQVSIGGGELSVRGVPGMEAETGLALRMALGRFDSGPLDEAVREWLDSAGPDPLIVVERLSALDEESAQAIAGLIEQGRVFVLMLTPVVADLPAVLAAQIDSGQLLFDSLTALEHGQVGRYLQDILGGTPGASLVARIFAYTGGHRALIHWVVRAARRADIVRLRSGDWEWRLDDEALLPALMEYEGEILGGIKVEVREKLLIFALAGSVPERDAAEHLGRDMIERLRHQQFLMFDRAGTGFGRSLSLRAAAVGELLLARVRPGEITQRWYQIGSHLNAAEGGPAAEVSIARWRVRAEGRIEPAEAIVLADKALGIGRFRAALDLIRSAPADLDPELRLLEARVHAALGDIDRALELLEPFDGGDRAELWSSGLALTTRIAIFHRTRGLAQLRRLHGRWKERAGEERPEEGAQGIPGLAHVLQLLLRDEDVAAAQKELRFGVNRATVAEDFTARMWVGAELGFGEDPHGGRHVLQTLLDDCAREPDAHEFIEPVMVLLLLIHTQFGWHADTSNLRHLPWENGLEQPFAVAAALDLMAAVSAMQGDRMRSCHRHADVAAQAFESRDPYALRPFALALASAAASYVDEDLAANARRRAERSPGSGVKYLDFVRTGLLQIGTGPTTGAVAARIARLADEARAAGQFGQHHELLLLAMLGGNTEAAATVLADGGSITTGRAMVVRLFAEAMLTDDPGEVLDAVESFLDRDAGYLAANLLARVWPDLESLGPRKRDAVRLAVRARQGDTENSWLLSSFAGELELSEREQLIIRALRDGESTGAVASRVHLSVRTVEGIISRLIRRFGCSNRIELVSLGLV